MSNPSLQEIKGNIAFVRKQAGLTQDEMSKALKISQPAYSYYETGDKPIPLDKISKIAEILSIPLSSILGDTAKNLQNKDLLNAINSNLDRIANALEQIATQLKKN